MFIRNFLLFILVTFFAFTACQNNSLAKKDKDPNPKYHPLAFSPLTDEDLQQIGQAEIDTQTVQMLQHFYQYFWEGNDLWGEFLVAQGNTILIEKYRGYSNYQDSLKINAHTPIHLASISKNLTAMVLLKLVENKKLKLQQRVQTILPNFPYDSITVFDLLTHRSGLGNYDYYAETYNWIGEDAPDFTNQRMAEMFSECQPALLFKPNTQHSYCNTNYAFLALIIEQITRMPYPKAMKELLFDPLEMKDTYVFQKQNKDTASLSYYYNKKPWKWNAFDYIYGDKNIYSTARDLFKYSQAMFTENFLPKSLLDSAMTGYSYERDGIKNYGLGFRLREFANGKKITFHTGKWHGDNTLFMHLPDEKLTIIVLGNRLNRANYSAFSLVSLFGDYPLELESEDELLTVTDSTDQEKLDSLTESSKKIRKKKDSLQTVVKHRKDTLKTFIVPKKTAPKPVEIIPPKNQPKKDTIQKTDPYG